MTMKLILGGARSGKSSQAEEFARDEEEVIYLATGVATDEEMERRISRHREDRPEDWDTIEEPVEIRKALEGISETFSGAVILDCLGFWLSNLLREVDDRSPPHLEDFLGEKIEKELAPAREGDYDLVVVSNIVGMGVIPGSSAGRRFRDGLGRVNQVVAKSADEVYLMVAGIPLRIK